MNKDLYNLWLNNIDKNDKEKLLGLSETEVEEAFYGSLEFGTAGLRGKIGIGPNRMNKYVIRFVTYGFYKYLKSKFNNLNIKGIVISHDNRLFSREFAKNTAEVFGNFGVKVYMFSDLRPTPELSFAVRKLGCCAGVMITASHNPSTYNGYKVYDETGCQLVPDLIDEVIENISSIKDIFDIKYTDFDKLNINYCDEEIDKAYLDLVKSISVNEINKEDKNKLEFVYTPLHGTGGVHLPKLLCDLGYDCVPVSEQMVHDPLFTTCPSPNPENINAFKYASDLGLKLKADILLANDPDADRMGVAIYDEKINNYHYLTGNQTGAIILDYLGKYAPHNDKGETCVYNTIVTSELAKLICKKYNLKLVQTLTGFKYIGEQARLLEETNDKFFFGYEESYGCVVKDFVRDKDALQACVILAEMACFYKKQENKTLYDKLLDLYKEYGFFKDEVMSYTFDSIDGLSKMKEIMEKIRFSVLTKIGDKKVIKKADYKASIGMNYEINSEFRILLPKSDVIKYWIKDSGWVCFRPSGTEPKLKIYLSIYDKDEVSTLKLVDKIKEEINDMIK